MQKFWERFVRFLFPRESDSWLSILRIGLGLQVTIYALSARADWIDLFGSNGNGLVNRELTEALVSTGSLLAPRLGWLIWAGAKIGLSESSVLWSAWTLLVSAGICLILGIFCRPAAVLAWFLHLSAVKSAELLTYGMDNFTTIGLFYLMLSPLPDRYALDLCIWKRPMRDPQLLGFFRRVLQVHVCIIYFFSGMTKFLGVQWWTGDSIWRALTSPPYNFVSPDLLTNWKYLLPLVGILTCVVETGYPVFIWPKRTRLTWLALTCGMHVAIGCTMGLYLFSLIMIILNLAGFGPGSWPHHNEVEGSTAQEARV
jgi:hypothetical protein